MIEMCRSGRELSPSPAATSLAILAALTMAAASSMLGFLFHGQLHVCRGIGGISNAIGLNYHLVNVVALRALKGVEVETDPRGHDASEHHVCTALWASRAMDVNVDVVGQVGFLHDAFPSRRRERNTLCHR
jgi:hypothetical protein